MTDVVSPEKRSLMMAGITATNTKPELLVRKALHRLGFRYSLHVKNLPGSPDMYLRKYNTVIFINGCFWHAHNCDLFRLPKSKTQFWKEKLTTNAERDKSNIEKLNEKKVRVAVVWECALKRKKKLDIDAVILNLVCWIRQNPEDLFFELRG